MTDNNIENHVDKQKSDKNGSRKLILKQIVICSASWFSDLTAGITYGTPTVMVPQIRKYQNSTIDISESMEGLLKSIFGYASIPWVFIFTYLTVILGRRIPLFLLAITMISGNISLYFSKSYTHILLSEILQTSAIAAGTSISVVVVSEYAAPKYRGVLLTIKAALCFWGIWIANAMGTFLPWRSIPVLSFACSLFMLPIVFFPESPSWLASKGRFEECKIAHRWLRGTDEDSELELEKLIKSQEQYLREDRMKSKKYLKEIASMTKSGEFYKPILLGTVICLTYYCSGKTVCVLYSIDIIKKITDSEKMAYMGMLIIDGISILGMYIGSAVSRYVSRRTLLFTTSFASIICLFILSLYLYLISLSVVTENNFVSLSILSIFSISISSGIILLATSLIGETVPLKYRSISILVININLYLIYSVFIQSAPYIFRVFGLHGAFFVFGVSSSIFTGICYKYLPETKDKSLLEIEEYFKDSTGTKVFNRDQADVLLTYNIKVDKKVDK